MKESFFDKVKKTLARGATQSASAIEEAARTGKLHLDIMNEKRKLNSNFEELGKFLYQQIEAQGEEGVDGDPELIKKIGEIKLIKDELARLRSQLDSGERVDEEDEDYKSGV